MNCFNPVRIVYKSSKRNTPKFPSSLTPGDKLTVACGKCLACRITKRREWSMRCVHELHMHDGTGLFVTLTYDEDHLPDDLSLNPIHLRNFVKRLRSRLSPLRFRYFGCGEYGELNGRPHYHLLLFGLSREHLLDIFESWKFCDWDRLMRDPFRKPIGNITTQTCQYVAGYMNKKYSGQLASDYYGSKVLPFRVSSQGIGRSYLDQYSSSIAKNMFIYFNCSITSVPRYYYERLVTHHGYHPEWLRSNRSVDPFDKEVNLINSILGFNLNMSYESMLKYFPPVPPSSRVDYTNYIRYTWLYQHTLALDSEAKKIRSEAALRNIRRKAKL